MNSHSSSSGGMMEQIANTMRTIEESESVWDHEKYTDPNSCWSKLAQKSVKFDAPQNLFLPDMSSWFYTLWMENKFNLRDIFRALVKFRIGDSNSMRRQQVSSGLSRHPLRQTTNYCNQNSSHDHPHFNHNKSNNQQYFPSQEKYMKSQVKCNDCPMEVNKMQQPINSRSTPFILNCESRQSSSTCCSSSRNFSNQNNNNDNGQHNNNHNDDGPMENLWMYDDPCYSQEETNSLKTRDSGGQFSSGHKSSPEQINFSHLEEEPLIYPAGMDSSFSQPTSQKNENADKDDMGTLLNSTSPTSHPESDKQNEESNANNTDNQNPTITTPIPVFGDFNANDAKKLLKTKNSENLSTAAKFSRIKNETVFVFDTSNAKEAYWLADGEDWKINKVRSIPWRNPAVEGRVYTLKRNGQRKNVTKIEYWPLGEKYNNWATWKCQRVVVHYKGDLSSFHFPRSSISSAENADSLSYTGIPIKTKNTPQSTLSKIDEKLKTGLKGKAVYKTLSLESKRLEIQGQPGYEIKNTRQIYNRQQAIKRNAPIYDNDIGDLCGIGKEFPLVLPSIRINPSTFIVSSHPELHQHLDEFHSLSDGFVFHYDTTFSCGPFFVSILSVRHPALVENPAIPVSVLYHEYQDGRETHKPFFEVVSQSLKCLNKPNNLFVSDREKGIIAAASDVLSNMKYIYCYNHIRKNVRDWTFKNYRKDKKYARSLQLDIKRLLWMKSTEDFDNYLKSRCCLEEVGGEIEEEEEEEEENQTSGLSALDENGKPYTLDIGQEEEEKLDQGLKRWDTKFQKYFTRYLEKDIRQCFRGVIKMKCTFNLNSGVTNNASESLNDVAKHHLFEANEVKTIYGLVKYIHEWQSVILLDIHKAFQGLPSNYKVKPEFQNKLGGLSQIKVPDSTIIFSDTLREARLPKKKQRIEVDINFSIKEKMAQDVIENGKVKSVGDGFFSVADMGKKYMVHPLNKECTCGFTRCYHWIAASMTAGVYDHPKCQFLKEIKPTTVTDIYKKTRPKRSGKKGSNLLRVAQKFDEDVDGSDSNFNSSDDDECVTPNKQEETNSVPTSTTKSNTALSQSLSCPASTSGSKSTSSTTFNLKNTYSPSAFKTGPQPKSTSSPNSKMSSALKPTAIKKIKKPSVKKSTISSKSKVKSKSTSVSKSKQKASTSKGNLNTLNGHSALNVTQTEETSVPPPSPGAEPLASTLNEKDEELSSSTETSTTAQVSTSSSIPSAPHVPVPSSTCTKVVKNIVLPKITPKNGYAPLLEINSHTLTLRELKTLTGLNEEEKKSLKKDKKYSSLLAHHLWLSDGVIFLYLELIKYEKTSILNYTQAQRIFTPEKSGLELRMFSDVSGIKFAQWINSELGFILYHQNQNHWILLAAKLHEQTVYVMDPKNKWQPSDADKMSVDNTLNKARGIIEEAEKFPWDFVTLNCPLQENDDDCGPFILYFAYCVQSGRTSFDKPPENFRSKILDTLIGNCNLDSKLKQNKKLVCNICGKSGPGKSKANWLKCKKCS